VSLGHLGTDTIITHNDSADDFFLNGERLDPTAKFASRLQNYIDLFRPANDFFFKIDTKNNFPTAAGLASSASGYAAMAMALNNFFGWGLDKTSISILARLGSGSASRSVYNGFVEWHRGEDENGLDSYAELIPEKWPELRLAVVTVSSASKPIGSTEGMKKTVETSTLYKSWPEKANRDIELIREAIQHKNFAQLGSTAESNALAMHATMIDTQPSVLYWLPETVATFHKIWQLRRDGLQLFFTIDAGPNVKILFQEKSEAVVKEKFSGADIIKPFS
jgi:diphosphomevalonate decarboxylase